MGQLKLLYPKVIPVAEEEDVLMAIHPDDAMEYLWFTTYYH